MRTVIVTGSAGLIGSEAVKRFANEGRLVVGIDSDMRAQFFGAEDSTKKTRFEDRLCGTKILSWSHYERSAAGQILWRFRSCVWHTWDKTEVVSAVARALLTSSASRRGVDRNRN